MSPNRWDYTGGIAQQCPGDVSAFASALIPPRRLAMPGSIFLTVGTTFFDDLVGVVDSQPFAQLMQQQGYTALTVQFGASLVRGRPF